MHIHELRAKTMQYLRPYCYGIARLAFSGERLKAGFLSAHELEAILPSGMWVEKGRNALLPERDLRHLLEKEGVISVAIGLPQLVSHRQAVSSETFDGRFIGLGQSESLPDLYDDNPEAEIQRLWFKLRFLIDDEIANSENMEVLMLAKISVSGGTFTLSDDYAPFALHAEAHPVMGNKIREILELLQSTSLRFSELAHPWRLEGSMLDSGWLRDRLIHAEISQAATIVSHSIITGAAIEVIYQPLLVLASRLVAIGGLSSSELPVWDYEDCYRCFRQIGETLSALIDQLRNGPDSVAYFKPRGGWLEAQIPVATRVGSYSIYLVIQDISETEFSKMAEPKLSSVTHIETIVSRALPGITMTRLNKVPYGVGGSATHYAWQVDGSDALWKEASSAGSIALHWLDLPKTAKVALVFFRL